MVRINPLSEQVPNGWILLKKFFGLLGFPYCLPSFCGQNWLLIQNNREIVFPPRDFLT